MTEMFYIIFFFIGYFIGRDDRPDPKKMVYRARQLGKVMTSGIKNSTVSPGIVYRPTANKLRSFKNDPHRDGMLEGLKKIPELN